MVLIIRNNVIEITNKFHVGRGEKGEVLSQGPMQVLSWNVRGYNTPNKHHLLKCCINKYKYELLLIQETKIDKENLTNLNKKLGIMEIYGV